VSHPVNHEDLMRFLDGELPPKERATVAAHVDLCTECRREFVVFQSMKSGLREMVAENGIGDSLWQSIRNRLVHPTAWMLIIIGVGFWVAWAVYAWITRPDRFWLKFAEGSIVVGLALLLAIAVGDRLRDLRTDPYREIHR
jgi:hypothetical protein